jgi:hypothetical protein
VISPSAGIDNTCAVHSSHGEPSSHVHLGASSPSSVKQASMRHGVRFW